MQIATRSVAPLARAVRPAGPVLRVAPRSLKVAVRAADNDEQASTSEPQLEGASTSAASVQNFAILNPMTEAINGRSAMLGFVAAVVSEFVTHQAITSQIAGKYAELELVEKPIGGSTLGFAMIVFMVTLGSLAPKLLDNADPDSKSFGPFTPGLELQLGRVAQMGFLGLVLVEVLKGSSLL